MTGDQTSNNLWCHTMPLFVHTLRPLHSTLAKTGRCKENDGLQNPRVPEKSLSVLQNASQNLVFCCKKKAHPLERVSGVLVNFRNRTGQQAKPKLWDRWHSLFTYALAVWTNWFPTVLPPCHFSDIWTRQTIISLWRNKNFMCWHVIFSWSRFLKTTFFWSLRPFPTPFFPHIQLSRLANSWDSKSKNFLGFTVPNEWRHMWHLRVHATLWAMANLAKSRWEKTSAAEHEVQVKIKLLKSRWEKTSAAEHEVQVKIQLLKSRWEKTSAAEHEVQVKIKLLKSRWEKTSAAEHEVQVKIKLMKSRWEKTSAAEHEVQVKIQLRSKSNVCHYHHPPTQTPPTKKKNLSVASKLYWSQDERRHQQRSMKCKWRSSCWSQDERRHQQRNMKCKWRSSCWSQDERRHQQRNMKCKWRSSCWSPDERRHQQRSMKCKWRSSWWSQDERRHQQRNMKCKWRSSCWSQDERRHQQRSMKCKWRSSCLSQEQRLLLSPPTHPKPPPHPKPQKHQKNPKFPTAPRRSGSN